MIIFCFFYAPGAHHPENERISFYDELRDGYGKYQKNVQIFLLGDSNARLGYFSLDRDIHGKFVSNSNKPLFLGFLEYSGAQYVDGYFARGVPTYEIQGKKRSLIDVCLTNALHRICSFTVLPNILGVSPQTCHKAIKLVISNSIQYRPEPNEEKIRKFRYCTYENLEKVRDSVSKDINDLLLIRKGSKSSVSFFNYSVLKRLFIKAKMILLGFVKNRSTKEVLGKKVQRFQHQI